MQKMNAPRCVIFISQKMENPTHNGREKNIEITFNTRTMSSAHSEKYKPCTACTGHRNTSKCGCLYREGGSDGCGSW